MPKIPKTMKEFKPGDKFILNHYFFPKKLMEIMRCSANGSSIWICKTIDNTILINNNGEANCDNLIDDPFLPKIDEEFMRKITVEKCPEYLKQ